MSSPLLDIGINNATGIVWNITGPSDMTLFEVNDAAEVIYELIDPSANLIFGAVVDPNLAATKEVTITLIATGLGGAQPLPPAAQRQASASSQPAGKGQQQQQQAPAASEPGFSVPDFLRRRMRK